MNAKTKAEEETARRTQELTAGLPSSARHENFHLVDRYLSRTCPQRITGTEIENTDPASG